MPKSKKNNNNSKKSSQSSPIPPDIKLIQIDETICSRLSQKKERFPTSPGISKENLELLNSLEQDLKLLIESDLIENDAQENESEEE